MSNEVVSNMPPVFWRAGAVVRNKKSGRKFVIYKEQLSDDDSEPVCGRPHEDGDYSYLCGSDYCRCSQ